MQNAGARLRRFRAKNGITIRAAAQAIGAAHPSYLAWEANKQTPLPAYRKAIAIWTGGYVAEPMWPVSQREREAEAALANVKPFRPEAA